MAMKLLRVALAAILTLACLTGATTPALAQAQKSISQLPRASGPISGSALLPIDIPQVSPPGGYQTQAITANQLGTLGGNLVNTFNGRSGDVKLVTGDVTAPMTASAAGVLSITGLAGGVLAGAGPAFTVTPTLGVAGTSTGTLRLAGANSGAITIQPQAAAGTYNLNLPTGAGASGQPLLSGGGGAAAMTFGTLGPAAGGTGLTGGTSGGVLAFTGATTIVSSGALTLNGVVLGGGAGAAPASTAAGTDAQVLLGQTGAAPTWNTVTSDVTVSTIGAASIVNAVVTNAKLVNMVNGSVKGRVTAGTGTPEDIAAGQLPATATNDSAAAGRIGEYMASTVATNAISLSTGASANITSLPLTAGDWDVFCNAGFSGNVATTVTNLIASISTTSATLTGSSLSEARQAWQAETLFVNSSTVYLGAGPTRQSLSGPNTVYCVVQSSFGVNTMTAGGTLRARRIR